MNTPDPASFAFFAFGTPYRVRTLREGRTLPSKPRNTATGAEVLPTVSEPLVDVVRVRPDLVAVVRDCLAGMDWLTETDQAAAALALHYAEMIETAEDRAKVLGWHGPHLLNTLRALGGTPAERKALGVEERVGGRLAELRAIRS